MPKIHTKKKERKKEKEKRISGLKRCKKMVHCMIIGSRWFLRISLCSVPSVGKHLDLFPHS